MNCPCGGREQTLTEFCVELAGLPIGVRALFPQTEEFCRDYLCRKEPLFTVELSQELLDREQAYNRETAEAEGREPFSVSPIYLEQLALYRQIAEVSPDHGVLLFHGSAVAVDGQVYLFTAKSGTGKSTHARLWRRRFGDRALMVNDDKPLLRFSEQGVLACGTPWDGKHRLSTPISLPLKAVCLLTRARENAIAPLSAGEAFPHLYQQCYHPTGAVQMSETLTLLGQLCRQTRLYRLGCNMDPEAAEISYQGMQEENT